MKHTEFTTQLKLLTRLRLWLSHLNDHKFNHNFRHCINPFSSFSLSVENTFTFSVIIFHCKDKPCVSGGKKRSLFGKFRVLCILVTSVLRFALLPYYRREMVWHFSEFQGQYFFCVTNKQFCFLKWISFWMGSETGKHWKVCYFADVAGMSHVLYRFWLCVIGWTCKTKWMFMIL